MTWNRCTPDDLNRLRAIVGVEHVLTSAAVIEQNSRDEGYLVTKTPPDVVVMPDTTEQVAAILKLAHVRCIPVTTRGAGTSIEGNPVPMYGGIVVNMARFTRILAVRPEDFLVIVEPGVTHRRLNQALKAYGLFFPPDPGADASIGGMIANNASGVRTVRYGATKDLVAKMTVVLAQGEVVEMGSHAHKTSSGFDLVHLIVGSEGTLGIVTQASLRLVGLPTTLSVAVAAFPTTHAAAQAVFEIMRWGYKPAALELMTPELLALLNREKGLGLLETPTLFLEFHGASEVALKQELTEVQDICQQAGGIAFQAGLGPDSRAKLWEARYQSYEVIRRAHPGLTPFVGDVAVPISRFPAMVDYSIEVIKETGVIAYPFGHAGDGNLHLVYMGKFDDEQSWGQIEKANQAIVLRSLELDGTATGEHGVGIGKRQFMAQEHGKSLDLMRQIKTLLDPQGILNPGKIFL